MKSDWRDFLAAVLLVTITTVWVYVYIKDVNSEKFTAPPEVSGVLIATITAVVGEGVLRRLRDKDK